MIYKKEEKMHERTTNPQQTKKMKEILSVAEAPSSQGMGDYKK
jgi:hypothetical protein